MVKDTQLVLPGADVLTEIAGYWRPIERVVSVSRRAHALLRDLHRAWKDRSVPTILALEEAIGEGHRDEALKLVQKLRLCKRKGDKRLRRVSEARTAHWEGRIRRKQIDPDADDAHQKRDAVWSLYEEAEELCTSDEEGLRAEILKSKSMVCREIDKSPRFALEWMNKALELESYCEDAVRAELHRVRASHLRDDRRWAEGMDEYKRAHDILHVVLDQSKQAHRVLGTMVQLSVCWRSLCKLHVMREQFTDAERCIAEARLLPMGKPQIFDLALDELQILCKRKSATRGLAQRNPGKRRQRQLIATCKEYMSYVRVTRQKRYTRMEERYPGLRDVVG